MASKARELAKAVEWADYRKVEQLLKAGADADALDKDADGLLALVLSGLNSFKTTVVNKELVKVRVYPLEDIQATISLLLRHRVNPNRLGADHGSPLNSAAAAGLLPVMRLLIAGGADPNLPDAIGDTPLHWAMHSRNPKAVKYLLEQGANPLVANQEKETALQVAQRRARQEPKEFGASLELIQHAATQAKRPVIRKAPVPAQERNVGAWDFLEFMFAGHAEWSLVAVKAPLAQVAKELATHYGAHSEKVEPKPAKKPGVVAPMVAAAEIKNNPWIVVLRSLFVGAAGDFEDVRVVAKKFSASLKTGAVTFTFEDTSGAMGYAIFEKGKVLEETEWEGSAFAYFRSKLRQQPKLKGDGHDFADEVFREQGIYLPACYPQEQGKKRWLAVGAESKGRIGRAELFAMVGD